MDSFLVLMGLVAYVLVIFSVLTGTRIIKANFKYHRIIGKIGLAVASIHALSMIYFNFF